MARRPISSAEKNHVNTGKMASPNMAAPIGPREN